MAKPTVSVLICTHHPSRFERLGQALHSLGSQSQAPDEVIVVVDGGADLLAQASAAFPQARVLANARTKGLSGARNTGVLAASGEIVAFLDDDAIAAENWLESLRNAFASQFTSGVGGPIEASWPHRGPAWLPAEFNWVIGCSFAGQAVERGRIRNLIGCNMAFRRGALLLAGLFDEEMGRVGANAAGDEETELCVRIKQVFPTAELSHSDAMAVRHQIDEHRARLAYFIKRCWAEGRSKARMAKMHPGSLSSESHHLFSVLPRSFFRHIAAQVTGRDVHGVAKAGALALGTGLVVGSYLLGRISMTKAEPTSTPFSPIRVCDVDLDALSDIPAGKSEAGITYGNAHCVARRDGMLAGVVQVPLYGADLDASSLEQALGEILPAHVRPSPWALHEPQRTRVVVATRDRPEMLARCLDSLLAQDHPDFEIVVVDNAPSSGETRTLIASRYADDGRVHYALEPIPGLANAHNRGLAGLDAELVAFTDDDVVADRQWLSRLTAPFSESHEIGCVSGGIVPAELETRAQYWTEQHGAFLKGVQRRDFDLRANHPQSPLFPYAAGQLGSGANMAFSRAAIEAIGGRFDPALGAGTPTRGGDDLAAFADVILAGYRLVYLPHALVWHYHRRGSDGMKRQAFGYGMGLGAYLARCLVRKPSRAVTFALAAPAALRHILSKRSSKNVRLPSDYPASFLRSERLGILAGAWAYLTTRGPRRPLPGSQAATSAPDHVWKGS